MSNPKITILRGEGLIETSNKVKVQVDEETIIVDCDKLIITSGSKTLIPSITGMDLDAVITSNEAINLTEIPESMTIIGAGAIGLEFATLFNAMGTKITVVELQDKILPQEDSEITAELLKLMKRQGIKFKLGAKVKEIKKANSSDVMLNSFQHRISEQPCDPAPRFSRRPGLHASYLRRFPLSTSSE